MGDRPGGSTRAWWLIVLLLSFIPILGLFTTSRVFFVRDLSFFFWSRHLWLRHTLFSGQAPWWDPYVASGQSAISDALNELLMPLTLAIRLLPSDVVSFNLWVALPLPIAATGTFVFLRQHFGDGARNSAAALGACAFALSGPIVSMLNLPNLAWSVALLPWVMAAVHRSSAIGPRSSAIGLRSVVIDHRLALPIAFALQALCGEPVTWAATGALALAYRPRLSTIGGLAGGTLLAAGQLVPTFLAGVRAHRAALATPDFWSLHPASLWEAVAPQVFGNYYDAFLADLPWISALNFGRDPFFYSLYIGPLVLLLAAIGAIERPRRSLFWVTALVVFTIAAFGGYTPLYPMLRRLVPALMYFRFPVKYIALAVFAAAVLAAEGWAAITSGVAQKRLNVPAAAAIVGGAGLIIVGAVAIRPAAVVMVSRALAVAAHLKNPDAGALFLARVAPPLAFRASALLLAGGLLTALVARGRAAAWLLFAVVCADLLVTNAGLNMTMELSKLTPPAWFTSASGEQRLYIGGRVRGYMNGADPDAVSTWQIPAEGTAIEGRMELNALLPMAPSGWRVREALSYDLPYLWPARYDQTVRRFEMAGTPERAAFLRRTGVRWCVLPRTRHDYVGQDRWRVIDEVDDWNMRVYECHPDATRVFLSTTIAVGTDPSDEAWQRDALFDPSLPDDAVRLGEMPAVAGRPGPLAPSSVRIVQDTANSVTVEAALDAPAALVLRDSYDPSWIATVDDLPATVGRANGIYRAVALPPGRHTVRFTYRPQELLVGLTLSVTTVIIGFFGFFGFFRFSGFRGPEVRSLKARRTRRLPNPANPENPTPPSRGDRGFTLLELMIVLAILAILLSVAFSEYRGLEARGNEASALSSMRAIAVAQSQFALTCGGTKYAATLEVLAQPVPQTGHAFISPDLALPNGFEKSGYKFQMTAKPIDGAPPACNGGAVAETYIATADPVKPGVSGAQFYGLNADRVIFTDTEKTFTGNMPETAAPSHGVEVKQDVK